MDVIGVGRAVMDYSLLVEKYPNVDEKTVALDRFYGSGSPVPNALCQLAAWGVSTSLVAVVGNDRDGDFFRDQIESAGVEVEQLFTRQQEATPRAFIWVEKKSGRRTVVLDRDIAPLSPDELPSQSISSARFLLIDGVEADAAIASAQMIREAGGQVMLDAGSVRGRMEEQVALADWLIVPVGFIREWYGSVDLFQAAKDLCDLGPKAVVVTNGAAGSVAAWDGRVEWFQAHRVEAIDTTGAGDVFHAGFLYGLIQHWNVSDCIRWASAAAALATTALGGRGCLPDKQQVEHLLEEAGVVLDGSRGGQE